MNKKLLALLLVGATAGQTARADFMGFVRAANALLNPIDMTGQKHEDQEDAKYAFAHREQVGADIFAPIVKHGDEAGYMEKVDGNSKFFPLEDYARKTFDRSTKKYVDNPINNDAAEVATHFNDTFTTVKAADGNEYYVQKDGTNPRVDANGFEIITKAKRDVSVGEQGRGKINAFFEAEDACAQDKDKKTPGGKTSEALWGFRQSVLGQRTSGALIASGWGAVIGAAVLAHSMAKADSDDEDEEENDDNA